MNYGWPRIPRRVRGSSPGSTGELIKYFVETRWQYGSFTVRLRIAQVWLRGFVVERCRSVVWFRETCQIQQCQDGGHGITTDNQGLSWTATGGTTDALWCWHHIRSGVSVLSLGQDCVIFQKHSRSTLNGHGGTTMVLRTHYVIPVAITDSLLYRRHPRILSNGHGCFEEFSPLNHPGSSQFVQVSLRFSTDWASSWSDTIPDVTGALTVTTDQCTVVNVISSVSTPPNDILKMQTGPCIIIITWANMKYSQYIASAMKSSIAELSRKLSFYFWISWKSRRDVYYVCVGFLVLFTE